MCGYCRPPAGGSLTLPIGQVVTTTIHQRHRERKELELMNCMLVVCWLSCDVIFKHVQKETRNPAKTLPGPHCNAAHVNAPPLRVTVIIY